MSKGFEDFNFDELDDFTIDGEDSGNQGNRSDDAFNLSGDLGIESSNEALGLDDTDAQANKKLTKKNALITIICGIAFIAVVLVIVGLFTGDKSSNETKVSTKENKQTVEETTESVEAVNVTPEVQIEYRDKIVEKTIEVQTDSGWKEFTSADGLNWDAGYIKTTFTVTKVTHYAKNVNQGATNNTDCMVKSVLTGIISGYSGTYELEVPYSLGSYIKEGNYFDVEVQVGTNPNGGLVIGEIKYE